MKSVKMEDFQEWKFEKAKIAIFDLEYCKVS